MNHTEERLLSRQDVADYLNVTKSAIEKWGKQGPPMLRVGGTVRYRMADVNKWIEERTNRS